MNAPGTASITFVAGPLKGRVFPLSQPVLIVGRDDGNTIVIKDDPYVSRVHARLLWQNAAWYIEKNPKASILRVNQQIVDQSILSDGAYVTLGEHSVFQFVATVAAPSTLPPATLPAFTPPVRKPVSAPVVPGYKGMQQGPDGTVIGQPLELGIPTLEVTSNASNERNTYRLDRPTISIGRKAALNDIVIDNQSVSSTHLQIVREGNQLILVHPYPGRPNTTNGLLHNGGKIRGDEHFRKVLEDGDFFRIGNENGTFVTLTYHDGRKAQQEALPPMLPIKLNEEVVTIGRLSDSMNTVVLPHPQVSAHHARLDREGGTYRLRDLHSTNHVYVNNQLVTDALLKMGDEIRIGPYKLVFEITQLKQYDESNYIRINAQDLKKYGNEHVTLLNNISLSIAPRKFVAIVGGSGAGKTTLLKALSGLRPAEEGKVLYNGQDYYSNLAAFSTQLGYVPQDDIVHRDLPVARALYYAAKLRLPSDFTEEQIQKRIDEVLEDVELTGKRNLLIKSLSGGQRKRVSIALELLANPCLFFLDEPTSGLDPGLDRKMMFLLRKLADKGHTVILVTHATNNISTCDYVCFLAYGGRLAYFGPPEQAKKHFEKDDFADIYANLDPAEDKAIPETAEADFKKSRDYQEYVVTPLKEVKRPSPPPINPGQITSTPRPKRSNPLQQFILLCTRQVELLKNNVSNLLILLLQAPLIALVLMILVRFEIASGIFDGNNIVQCSPRVVATSVTATPSGPPPTLPNVNTTQVDCQKVLAFLKSNQTFFQSATTGQEYAHSRGGPDKALQDFILPGGGDAQRVIFLVAFFAVLFGCINGTREIVKEVAIYERERAVNLGILPYMFSKIFVLGMLAVVQSASILLIVELFEPLDKGVFLPVLLEVYITLALTAVAGVLLGLVVSASAPNDDTANSLLPIIIVPQVIFAGSIIPMKDWPTQIIAVIFPIRWAMAALGTSLGLHADKIDQGTLFGNDSIYRETLFSVYTQSDAIQRIVISWIALGVTIVVMTALIGIFLKLKDNRG